jgi:hypothetical protein
MPLPVTRTANQNITRAMMAQAKKIETKLKALETRRKTGALNASISFRYIDGKFVFRALSYGKFVDEGTYGRRRETEVSKRVWPQYIARAARGQNRGIKPLNFTRAMEGIKKDIVSIIKPFIVEDVKKQIMDELKKNNKK